MAASCQGPFTKGAGPGADRFLGSLLALLAAGSAQAACPASAAPARGVRSQIVSNLASQWTRAAQLPVAFPGPPGPPQGALDAELGAFLAGKRDFALVSRELADVDLATFRAAHGGRAPLVVPVAAGNWNRFGYVDAVVVVVHAGNPIRSLSFRQLDAIFSTTRLRGGPPVAHWRDLGVDGGSGALPIKPVGGGGWMGEESARALTIRRHVLSVGNRRGRWRPAPDSGEESDVVARVGTDPAAIGFTGLGHITAAVRVVPIAAPGRAAVMPTRESARAGNYPLLRTVDMLLDAQSASATTRRFLRFLLSAKGQAVLEEGDFMPLPRRALGRARRIAMRLGCAIRS